MTEDILALLDRLEVVAEAATPGQWVSNRFQTQDGQEVWVFQTSGFALGTTKVRANAEFIAACDPDTILRLIARLRDREEKVSMLRRKVLGYE